MENSDCKILWDFTIYTGSHLAHDRPDITVAHKSSPFKTYLIDITIPGDSRMHQKFVEKERYSDLCIVLNRLWKTSCTVVPIVLGSLGSIPLSLSSELRKIGVTINSIPTMQKSVVLSTCRILRHYLT